jgi:hypothetical protein
MKRCPQCEFIYEDDQSLCDMDGVLLVFDSRTLPNSHALQKVARLQSCATSKPRRAGFCHGDSRLVLGMVYYVSTQRHARQSTLEIPAASAATTSNPAPEVVNPTPQAQPSELFRLRLSKHCSLHRARNPRLRQSKIGRKIPLLKLPSKPR